MLHPRFTAFAATLTLAAAGAHAQTTTFVSIPDFWNMDFGDISTLPTYDGGANSWTQGYEDSMNYVMDAVASENPDFVLSGGDLVMGHWDSDRDNRDIFGDTATFAGKQAAIDAAGDFYYGIWKDQFTSRGITNVYAAVGDHEVGDNPWNNGSDHAKLVPDFKEEFADHFTRDAGGNPLYTNRPTGAAAGTAYAVQHGNLLIVTVDQFRQDSFGGAVSATLDSDQQAWVDNLLATTTADHVIVQGHTPIDDNPTVPARNSSQLKYQGGTSSDLWQSMVNHGADIYLAGEVHDDSVRKNNGEDLIQVITGGIVGESVSTQYLVGTVDGDTITLEVKDIALTNIGSSSSSGGLWQTGSNRPHADVAVTNPAAAPATIGTLTIDKSTGSTVFLNATGTFASLATTGPIGLAGRWEMEEGEPSNITADTVSGLSTAAFGAGVSFAGQGGEPGSSDALSFAGTGEVATNRTGDDLGITGTGAKTLVAWIKTSASAGRQGILSYSPSGGSGAGQDLRLVYDADANQLRLEVSSGADFINTVGLNDDQWHMIAAIIPDNAEAQDIVFYLDGQIIAGDGTSTRAIDTASSALAQLVIGNDQASNDGSANSGLFTGLIDGVRVYDVALDKAALDAIYVPEPASLAVLAAAGGALMLRRRVR